jgi:hypothetical protein
MDYTTDLVVFCPHEICICGNSRFFVDYVVFDLSLKFPATALGVLTQCIFIWQKRIERPVEPIVIDLVSVNPKNAVIFHTPVA